MLDWRVLPPVSALRALAAFSETKNVVDAGHALGVSHAAISQQLRNLETHLDVTLFDRGGRALVLTPAGVDLAAEVHKAFGDMIRAVNHAVGADADKPLHLSMTPTFAASWLMPRLPRFRALHPDVELLLNPTPALVDLSPEGADMAIRYGTGDWAGLDADMLLASPMVVIGAPSLIGQGALPDAATLATLPWLQEIGTSESTRWLDQNGDGPWIRRGLTQVPGNLMLDGARDGQGVAVMVRAFVERDIAAGRLRVVSTDPQTGKGYFLVTRKGTIMRPILRDFARWIKREASRVEPRV